MKILHFETIDSTSSHAARLVQDDEPRPFAVVSKSQTQGRGRSGKTWLSPEGGLYLTLVIDSQDLASYKQGQWPLLVATGLALWLDRQFGFRATIKWPNDLLFAGRKLAGILCESSVQAGVWGPVLIGIGLNVHEAPDVAEQQSISVDRILGRKVDRPLQALAESMLEQLYALVKQADGLQQASRFALETGQLWVDSQGDFIRLQGLDSEGALEVLHLHDHRTASLASVRHDYQWIYQQDKAWPLLLADIGNTLCKLTAYRDGKSGPAALSLRFDPNAAPEAWDAILKPLRELKLPQGWPVHAIAVSDQGRDRVARLLKEAGLQLVPVPKRALRVRFDRYQFAELGIDRVALVEAARALMPEQNLLIVSAGTCVTVEVLQHDAQYLGGYILPGLQMKLDAMHQKTARLPPVKLSELDVVPQNADLILGRDTRSAMLEGVVSETSLAVKALCQQLERSWPGKPWQLITTGGDGEVLGQRLNVPYIPGLILQGVRLMVLGGLVAS